MVYNSIYDSSKPVYETVHQNLVLERTLKPKFDSVQLKNHSILATLINLFIPLSYKVTLPQLVSVLSGTQLQVTKKQIMYVLINVCVQGFVATGVLVWVGTHGQSRYVRELEGWDLSYIQIIEIRILTKETYILKLYASFTDIKH